MAKILAFRRSSDDYEDVVELLRKLAEQEREERECKWLEAALQKAKRIPSEYGGSALLSMRCFRNQSMAEVTRMDHPFG